VTVRILEDGDFSTSESRLKDFKQMMQMLTGLRVEKFIFVNVKAAQQELRPTA